MLIIILLITIVSASFGSNLTTTLTETVVKVEPTLIEFGNPAGDPIPIPGTQFTITVKIYNVTDLYGFDLKFRWNATYLEYVSRSVRVPRDIYLDGVLWNPVLQLRDEVNATEGTYWAAYSSIDPAPSFNGTGAVFTMTFEVIKQPYDYETGGPNVDPIDIILDFSSTDLAPRVSGDPIVPITHTVEPANIRIWERLSEVPTYPILKVMPTKVENMPMNNTFNIDIWILGVNETYDVANFSITLNFNSTLIEANEISEGSWPKSYAEDSIEILKQISNATGTATYALELVPPKKPDPPTTGILFTVTFHVINESLQYPPPSCELTLSPTEIFDKNIGSIPHITENGTYIAYRPPPTAKFTWTPSGNILPPGQTITFNASESYHPLGIKLYAWDFGDGNKTTVETPIITHLYKATGTLIVVLNVTDSGNFWNTISATLFIVEPPPKPYFAVDPAYVKFGPYPPQATGQQFNISIYIKSLDAAWDLNDVKFSLSFNTTLIDIIDDLNDVIIDPIWRGPKEVTVARPADMLAKISITAARGPSAPPSGNVLAATIKFTVKHQGIYPTVDNSPINLSDISLTGTLGEIPTQSPIHGQVVIEGLTSPVIKVEPSLIEYHENAVGKEFTVAIKIVNVTNLYGFDIKFRWNTTILEYVNHSVHIPLNAYPDGVLCNPILSLENTVNQTTGTYSIAYASMVPAPSFNGTGTVFTITFRVKYHPVQPEPTANITLEFYSTDLSDNGANPIPHTTQHSTVILHQILSNLSEASPIDIIPYVAGVVAMVIISIIAIYFVKIRKPK